MIFHIYVFCSSMICLILRNEYCTLIITEDLNVEKSIKMTFEKVAPNEEKWEKLAPNEENGANF